MNWSVKDSLNSDSITTLCNGLFFIILNNKITLKKKLGYSLIGGFETFGY